MPLTLESLPNDIRMEIYRNVLKGTDDIHPDPDNGRFDHDMPTGKPSGCLPILLTSKLLHEEATSVLYSENTFIFSEHPIGATPFFTASVNAALPRCDFTTMYDFVLAIGSHNRHKLRRIKLEFRVVSQFMDFPNELAHARPAGYGGGAVLAEAIELLARTNRLTIVEIARIPFQTPAFKNHPSFNLFYKESSLGVRLRLLKYIKRLVCKEVEEWASEPVRSARRTQYDQYMLFRAEMES